MKVEEAFVAGEERTLSNYCARLVLVCHCSEALRTNLWIAWTEEHLEASPATSLTVSQIAKDTGQVLSVNHLRYFTSP